MPEVLEGTLQYGGFESLSHRIIEGLSQRSSRGSKAHIKKENLKGYMYILECSDGSYYTGSTQNIELRLLQHQHGEGSNHTKKHLPVKLVYYEEFPRIDLAFYREKQIQGWSRKKKLALINGELDKLPELAVSYRDLKKEK